MCHPSVAGKFTSTFRFTSAVAVIALVLGGLPALTSADTMYRWQDKDGHMHFSNRSGRVPSGARAARLPNIGVARVPAKQPAAPSRPAAAGEAEVVGPARVARCGPPDPTRLINAVVSSIPPHVTRGPGGQAPEIALFVAAEPVSYSADGVLQIVPGQDWNDSTVAVDQGAIAYPASGACPRTPPLDRYAVTSERRRVAASSRCEDYRGASTEIEIALRRNENIARTFAAASGRFSNVARRGGVFEAIGTDVALYPWLAQINAAQTEELAAETQELLDELTVAREEIDQAAQTLGCW
jgi:hypothetical protein